MNACIIVKDEDLEIYDEFAQVQQEMTEYFGTTFQLLNEETDVQEDVKFNPETILLDKSTISLSATQKNDEEHLKSINKNLQTFDCKVCDYTTKQKRYLVAHLKKHWFKCNFCEFATHFRNSFTLHVKNHSKVKDYYCELCKYTSNHKKHFTRHIEMHSNLKKFLCHWCDHATKYKYNLIKHMKIHSVKKLSCDICSYTIEMKKSFDTHLKIHSIVKDIKCEICDYTTNHVT